MGVSRPKNLCTSSSRRLWCRRPRSPISGSMGLSSACIVLSSGESPGTPHNRRRSYCEKPLMR